MGPPGEGSWLANEFSGVKDRLGSIERRSEVRVASLALPFQNLLSTFLDECPFLTGAS